MWLLKIIKSSNYPKPQFRRQMEMEGPTEILTLKKIVIWK